MWPLYAAEPHHAIQIKRRHEPRLGIQRQASLRCIIRVLGRCCSPWVASMTSINKKMLTIWNGKSPFSQNLLQPFWPFLNFVFWCFQSDCMRVLRICTIKNTINYIMFMACNEEAILLGLFRHNLNCLGGIRFKIIFPPTFTVYKPENHVHSFLKAADETTTTARTGSSHTS